MFGKRPAYDVLVEVDTESIGDLLGDAYAAEFGIAPFQLNNCPDEFGRGPFRAGFAPTRRGREEQAVFVIDQGFMELEQCYGLDDCGKLRDTAGAYEQRGQAEQKTIERGQIRSALPGSIADQQLQFEK